MSVHTAFFCIGWMFEESGAYRPVLEHWTDARALITWMKRTDNLKRRINGTLQDSRKWTHRVLIAIRSTARSRNFLEFAGQTITRSPVSLHTHNLLCDHVPEERVNHLGSLLTYARHDCEICQVVALRANIQETADVPSIPFLWQTAIWKQYRLSVSVIDCSDFRFAILNSSLEHHINHCYDYRVLPFLIIEMYIHELLAAIARAKREEFHVDPPPSISERYDHHLRLQCRCLAYIPFLCWLIEFDILLDTAYACCANLRSCLLCDASIAQATLVHANQELCHLNHHLHFQISFQNHLQLSLQHSDSSRKSCCENCTQVKHMAYIAFALLPITVFATILGTYLHYFRVKWVMCLFMLVFLLHLILRHYIRITFKSVQDTFLPYLVESKRAALAILLHLTRILQ